MKYFIKKSFYIFLLNLLVIPIEATGATPIEGTGAEKSGESQAFNRPIRAERTSEKIEPFDYVRYIQQASDPVLTFSEQARQGGLFQPKHKESLNQLQEALNQNPKVTGLDMSGITWKKKRLEEILQLISSRPMTTLIFNNCSFNSRSIKTLSKDLPKSLTFLSLSNTNISDGDLTTLGKALSGLVNLDLSYNEEISDFGREALKTLIEVNSNLQILNLSGLKLTEISLDSLVSAVNKSSSLYSLALKDTDLTKNNNVKAMLSRLEQRNFENKLTTAGFTDLVKGELRNCYQGKNRSITLALCSYSINEAGIRALCMALEKMQRIQDLAFAYLDLSLENMETFLDIVTPRLDPSYKNRSFSWVSSRFTEDTLRKLSLSPFSTQVKHLNFSGNNLGDLAVYSLWPSIESLDLSNNAITDDTLRDMASTLTDHPLLRDLKLDGNPFTYKGALFLESWISKADSKGKGISFKNTPFEQAGEVYGKLYSFSCPFVSISSNMWTLITTDPNELELTTINPSSLARLGDGSPLDPNLTKLIVVQHFMGSPDEESKKIWEIGLTRGLQDIAGFLKLTTLSICAKEFKGIGDEGLSILSTLKNLEELDLPYQNLTDKSVSILISFSKLTVLNLKGNQLTDTGARSLFQRFPRATINLKKNPIKDEKYKYQEGLVKL